MICFIHNVIAIVLCVSPSLPQTEEIIVSEPRGGNLSVPLTLIREKGTYGIVTVSFEVSQHITGLYCFYAVYL